MYKLHLLQHPDWYRTGTSYCYFYIFEIIHHHSVIFSKTYPSFLTVKEGSTFLTKPLFPQERKDVTALRCSEPLRYKVGGPSKVSPYCAGWDRLIIRAFAQKNGESIYIHNYLLQRFVKGGCLGQEYLYIHAKHHDFQ